MFEALAPQLRDAGFDDAIAAECLTFAAEERRHGVLCGAVVEALGGEAVADVPARPRFPDHVDASRRAAAMRNVISVCCMSETVAVALIGAEKLEMPDGALRVLLSRIHADEVGHARFGWRLLERFAHTLSGDENAEIRCVHTRGAPRAPPATTSYRICRTAMRPSVVRRSDCAAEGMRGVCFSRP